MRDLEKLKKDLENFIDPSLKLTFKEGKSILDFKLDGDVIDLKIALKNLRRDEEKVKLEIARLVKITHGFLGLRIEFLQSKYKGLEKEPIYLGIISGKGGVGKSTVAANLAVALSRLNQKVGIIDADIYGSSLPSIFKLPIKPLKTSKDDLVIPAIYEGIEVISPEFFMPENQPLMWRGPMLGKLLEHFFDSVLWQDDLDFIIIDLPPGTGDIQLDVENHVPEALMLLVTTPHPNASHVALKAGLGAKEIGHQVIGVVENMSYYYNEANHQKEYIFGKGGGIKVSEMLDVPLLMEIPLREPLDETSNIYSELDMNGKLFIALASKVLKYKGER